MAYAFINYGDTKHTDSSLDFVGCTNRRTSGGFSRKKPVVHGLIGGFCDYLFCSTRRTGKQGQPHTGPTRWKLVICMRCMYVEVTPSSSLSSKRAGMVCVFLFSCKRSKSTLFPRIFRRNTGRGVAAENPRNGADSIALAPHASTRRYRLARQRQQPLTTGAQASVPNGLRGRKVRVCVHSVHCLLLTSKMKIVKRRDQHTQAPLSSRLPAHTTLGLQTRPYAICCRPSRNEGMFDGTAERQATVHQTIHTNAPRAFLPTPSTPTSTFNFFLPVSRKASPPCITYLRACSSPLHKALTTNTSCRYTSFSAPPCGIIMLL